VDRNFENVLLNTKRVALSNEYKFSGLSDGLHQSGVAKCRWAVEKFTAPAEAFKVNNKYAKVYESDCNDLLQRLMKPQVRNFCILLNKFSISIT